VIYKFLKTVTYFAMLAARNGELKLASFCSSGGSYFVPGRAELVHLQPLNGLLNVPPHLLSQNQHKKSTKTDKNPHFSI